MSVAVDQSDVQAVEQTDQKKSPENSVAEVSDAPTGLVVLSSSELMVLSSALSDQEKLQAALDEALSQLQIIREQVDVVYSASVLATNTYTHHFTHFMFLMRSANHLLPAGRISVFLEKLYLCYDQ